MKKFLSALLPVMFLSACVTYDNGYHLSTLSYSDLQHHNFVLQSFNGKQITPQGNKMLNLAFNENQQISGSLCNNFHGAASMAGNVMKGNMVSTLMACPDANLNAAEQALYQAFSKGAHLTLKGQTLTIRQGSNTFVYQLRDYVR